MSSKVFKTCLLVAVIGVFASAPQGFCQEKASVQDKLPVTSQEQLQDAPNKVPADYETIIIAADKKSRERAMMILELYKAFESDPRPEVLSKFISDDYVQHSSMAPDGADGIGMVFSLSVKKYPVELDVHKVMVVGDWAMPFLGPAWPPQPAPPHCTFLLTATR